MAKLFTALLAAAPLLGAAPLLAQGGSAASVDAPRAGPAKAEKMICRRIGETGSLARVTKVCLTKAEWERSARGHQGYAQDLQDALRTRPAGGE